VGSVLKPVKVISINSNQPIVEAFQTLLSNNILSAPVWDEASYSYTGYLCIEDLVSYLLLLEHEQEYKAGTSLEDILQRASQQEKDLRLTKRKSVILREEDVAPGAFVNYFASRHRIAPLSPTSKLMEAALRLVGGDKRVAVWDEEGGSTIANILSQSRLASFIWIERQLWETAIGEEVLEGTVEEWGFIPSHVFQVTEAEPALRAFELMDSTKKSAIAVVNASGILLTAASRDDLKVFLQSGSQDMMTQLRLPILDFLREVHGEIHPVPTVIKDDPFADVFQMMAAREGAHRVFLVDDIGHVEAVINLKDALAAIIRGVDMDAAPVRSTSTPRSGDVSLRRTQTMGVADQGMLSLRSKW